MNKVDHFWNWARDADTGERTLYLDGVIAETPWLGDEITPAAFKSELFADTGDVTIWLNSAGGDVVAASQIFAMLMDYKGHVTIKIDGIAASAASVLAMAGTTVLMAPTATMMIHEPQTIAVGDSEEMLRAKALLDEVRESVINAYEMRTNLSRTVLAHMLRDETWMNAKKAIDLGFADGMLTDEKRRPMDETPRAYSLRAVTNSLYDRMRRMPHNSTRPSGIPAESLEKRLLLLTH
jgi:ATP-dependent Clp protease protease subunit